LYRDCRWKFSGDKPNLNLLDIIRVEGEASWLGGKEVDNDRGRRLSITNVKMSNKLAKPIGACQN